MTRGKDKARLEDVKALLAEDGDFLRPLVQAVLQELLEAEMTEALGAEKGERTPARLGYRAGHYPHPGHARGQAGAAGAARPPRPLLDRAVERYQRSEKALVAALAEMYVQGVSTRKVTAITG